MLPSTKGAGPSDAGSGLPSHMDTMLYQQFERPGRCPLGQRSDRERGGDRHRSRRRRRYCRRNSTRNYASPGRDTSVGYRH